VSGGGGGARGVGSRGGFGYSIFDRCQLFTERSSLILSGLWAIRELNLNGEFRVSDMLAMKMDVL
jgi:hypothetical protein